MPPAKQTNVAAPQHLRDALVSTFINRDWDGFAAVLAALHQFIRGR